MQKRMSSRVKKNNINDSSDDEGEKIQEDECYGENGKNGKNDVKNREKNNNVVEKVSINKDEDEDDEDEDGDGEDEEEDEEDNEDVDDNEDEDACEKNDKEENDTSKILECCELLQHDQKKYLDPKLFPVHVHLYTSIYTKIPAKTPFFAKKPLDLFLLYKLVCDNGGFVRTTKNKRWGRIAAALGIPPHRTDSSSRLRIYYDSLLYKYEISHHSKVPKAPIMIKKNIANSATANVAQVIAPITNRISNNNNNNNNTSNDEVTKSKRNSKNNNSNHSNSNNSNYNNSNNMNDSSQFDIDCRGDVNLNNYNGLQSSNGQVGQIPLLNMNQIHSTNNHWQYDQSNIRNPAQNHDMMMTQSRFHQQDHLLSHHQSSLLSLQAKQATSLNYSPSSAVSFKLDPSSANNNNNNNNSNNNNNPDFNHLSLPLPMGSFQPSAMNFPPNFSHYNNPSLNAFQFQEAAPVAVTIEEQQQQQNQQQSQQYQQFAIQQATSFAQHQLRLQAATQMHHQQQHQMDILSPRPAQTSPKFTFKLNKY